MLAGPTDFLAHLLDSMQHVQSTEPSGLSASKLKNHLLTLHVLFPRELMPALDLLDRRAVSRMHVALVQEGEVSDGMEPSQDRPSFVYYVRSTQQTQTRGPPSRHRALDFDPPTHHEVRLKSWSCSCPAFVLAAFPASTQPARETPRSEPEPTRAGIMGGLTIGNHQPMCKHILACLLVEYGSTPLDAADDRIVSVEELAGWAAGWGD